MDRTETSLRGESSDRDCVGSSLEQRIEEDKLWARSDKKHSHKKESDTSEKGRQINSDKFVKCLLGSLPLGPLALAAVGRQDTGLDGPLV